MHSRRSNARRPTDPEPGASRFPGQGAACIGPRGVEATRLTWPFCVTTATTITFRPMSTGLGT